MAARPWLIIALLIASFAQLTLARLTPSERCSACDLAVDELEILFHEDSRTQADIDLRGRIDTSGRRHGKVIPFKHSEVRLYGLLDRLCKRIKDRQYAHAVRTVTGEALFYEPFHQSSSFVDALTGSTYEVSMKKERELNDYCNELVDDFQDDLFSWVRADKTAMEVRELLCHRPGGHCVGQAGAAPLDRTLFSYIRDKDGEFEAIPRETPVKMAEMAKVEGDGSVDVGSSITIEEGGPIEVASGNAAAVDGAAGGAAGDAGQGGVPEDGGVAAADALIAAAGLDGTANDAAARTEAAAGVVGESKDEL